MLETIDLCLAARSILLIMILTLCTMVALIYISEQLPSVILTHPSLSEVQAAASLSTNLKENIKGYQGLTLYNYSIGRYNIPYPAASEEYLSLPLIYIKPDGTEVFVNSTDPTLNGFCYTKLLINCHFNIVTNATRGKLLYLFDAGVITNQTFLNTLGERQTCEISLAAVVDANTGEILRSNLEYYRTVVKEADCFANHQQ